MYKRQAHALATLNLGAWLHGALQGRGCRVYSSDLRVMIDETGLYAYPDLTVVCGKADLAPTRPVTLRNPVVLVEVLSDTTEGIDRGAKAAHYRRRASVAAILYVSTTERSVELQSRNDDGTWTLREVGGAGAELQLACLGVQLPLDAIWEGFDDLAEAPG